MISARKFNSGGGEPPLAIPSGSAEPTAVSLRVGRADSRFPSGTVSGASPIFVIHAADRGFCGVFSPNAKARHKRTGNLHVLFREIFAYKHGEPIPKDDAFPVQPCKQKNAVRPAPNKRNIRIMEKARMLKHSQQVYNPAINIQLSSFQSASCLWLSAGNECPNTSPRSAHMPQCCDSGTPNTASIRIALCIDCRNTKKLHVSVQLF